METRANYVLIGAVTILGILGLIGFSLWLAKVEIDRQYAYYDVVFESVSGLDRAAVVRFNGLPVGQVVSLGFDEADPNRVRVRLELTANTPVTTGTRATLESQGVTGVSYVLLSGGDAESPLLRTVSSDAVPEIPAELSVVQTLVEGAPDLVAQAVEVMRQLVEILGPENQVYVAGILENLDNASGQLEAALTDFSSISRSVADATGQIGGFTDRLDVIAATATTTLESADATFRAATEVISTAEGSLAAATGALGGIETTAAGLNRAVVDEIPPLVSEARAAIRAIETTVTELGTNAQGLSVRLDGLIGIASDRLVQAESSLFGLEGTLARADTALGAVESASVSFEELMDGDGAELVSEARATLATADEAIAKLETVIADNLPMIVANTRSAVADVRAAVGTANDMVGQVSADVSSFSSRLVGLADSADTTLVAATSALEDASRTFARAEDALANAQRTFAAAETTFAGATRLIDEEAGPIARDLRETAMRINTAAADVGAGFEGIPALLASLTAVSEQARALPLDELVAAAASAVANADALIASEAVREVPQSVNLALAEVRLMLADLRAGGAVENVNATLASVRSFADELAAAQVAESLRNALTAAQSAASTVDTAAQGLPELIENLKTVSQRARDLPLDQLVNSGRQVLDTADRLLASEGMGEVPPRLAGALAELRLLLADLREGGAVENLNATLASADEAATAVAEAVRTLPALVAQLSQTASRADQALGSVAPGSDINRNTLMLLRELRDAAQSVNSLVTALERRPNSLLFGR
jgi:phospholipid/cholesterol/gamma-HCH transport system substrate-binding protein